jgi:hypothetical protein
MQPANSDFEDGYFSGGDQEEISDMQVSEKLNRTKINILGFLV